ncbi:hypothetical protein ACQEVB_31735 [Pseudonocardia sp. CA-107938]|uniref:hypothetical protein n=1 Tax=Pseudonocardia sp. CA-107938 TaxID=3240021 RepID=UPI003D8C9019
MDTAPLRAAYRAFLDAAAAVADADPAPPPGEWNADQVLAHVSIIAATTIATAAAVAAGVPTTYDNRISHDGWTLGHVATVAGGSAGMRDRIARQSEALATFDAAGLSDVELDTMVPTRLISQGAVLVDGPVSLRDILTGLAETEVPGHTAQLLALLGK